MNTEPSGPDPVELLRRLLRYDTSNPPGGEQECARFVQSLCAAAGLETRMIEREPGRTNLLVRLSGSGNAPPLLMQGHLDVVPANPDEWAVHPFAGELRDGFVWGRGALDMKGGIAMMLAALLRLAHEQRVPAGDILLACLADEEEGGGAGASFLVEEHAELFDGVRYALGEFGAFSLAVGGRRFYPIQVSERQLCCMRATVRAPGGHGSLSGGGVTDRLATLLERIEAAKLPVHVTEPARVMLAQMGGKLGWPARVLFAALRHPGLAPHALRLTGGSLAWAEPVLRNTASANIVRAGEKINVRPSEAVVEIDGRLLPGFRPKDLLTELSAELGDDVELEVTRHDAGPAEMDLSLLPLLSDVLVEHDPEALPVPMLMPGSSDARYLARLGIQTYGYLPMRLPADFDFSALIHARDERVPADAIRFGTDCLHRVLLRYGEDGGAGRPSAQP